MLRFSLCAEIMILLSNMMLMESGERRAGESICIDARSIKMGFYLQGSRAVTAIIRDTFNIHPRKCGGMYSIWFPDCYLTGLFMGVASMFL